MNRLLRISNQDEIPPQYRETPVGRLLEYHNLHRSFSPYPSAELLIGMCTDNRKHLHIPDNFAFIIRSGGTNLRHNEFKVSYAIAVGGAKRIVLIAHNQYGMVNLMSRWPVRPRTRVECRVGPGSGGRALPSLCADV